MKGFLEKKVACKKQEDLIMRMGWIKKNMFKKKTPEISCVKYVGQFSRIKTIFRCRKVLTTEAWGEICPSHSGYPVLGLFSAIFETS